MVEVLSSPTVDFRSLIPDEVDVYTDPHTRMKELVTSAAESIQMELSNLNFQEREEILQNVYAIMWELKTHEIIENVYIMNKLKERLAALQIYNQLVCNCHEDSTVLQIIDLVERIHGCGCGDLMVATLYWNRLQNAVSEFLEEFLPHMEEEENTFLPLLCKYFDYDELKEIKETVLIQHQVWKLRVQQEKNVYNLKENLQAEELKEHKKSSSYCEKLKDLAEYEKASFNLIPDEIILQIFGFLSPQDLMASSQVCSRWRGLAVKPEFWRSLPLNLWEQGSFHSWKPNEFYPEDLCSTSCQQDDYEMECDSTAFFYEKFERFLPQIGPHVRHIYLSGSKMITNHFLNNILQACEEASYLDVSYTNVSDYGMQKICDLKLTHLNLAGTNGITDSTIATLSKSKSELTYLNLSGCSQLTDTAVMKLYNFTDSLTFLDLSGCFRLTGSVMNALTAQCFNLIPENLYYCNMIQDGPYPLECNGCDNIDTDARICCLKYA